MNELSIATLAIEDGQSRLSRLGTKNTFKLNLSPDFIEDTADKLELRELQDIYAYVTQGFADMNVEAIALGGWGEIYINCAQNQEFAEILNKIIEARASEQAR